jgi:hypothetical protein
LVVERIGEDVTPVRHVVDVLGRFLRLRVARTAQVLNAAELGRDAGLRRAPTCGCSSLVYLVVVLPTWSWRRRMGALP